MITLNPYRNIDFAQCVTLVSNTHEHIYNQQLLENCYNRGVRNINLLHYQPSAPQKFTPNYQVAYIDYTSATDLTKTTKLSPKRNYNDFVDKDGNNIDLSDIVVLPNCEHVNIIGYTYMLHTNYLGSTFADPGWQKQTGDEQSGVQWRIQHPILTDAELFAGVRANLPFEKVFGTFNHPMDGMNGSYSQQEQFIRNSDGLIQAMEVFNRGYSPSVNQSFEDCYDHFLNKGYKLWATAVVDWQGDGTQFYANDLGANVLLLPSNYNNLTYIQKQNAILDAYIAGQYFPVGIGKLLITNIEESGDNVRFTFNKPANAIYCLYDGNKTFVASNTSVVVINTKKASKYVRIKALGDNNEFIFSNPIFVKNNVSNTINKFKVLF